MVHIKQVKFRKEDPYYDIELRLSTDFSTLQHVYVVKNSLKRRKILLKEAYQRP